MSYQVTCICGYRFEVSGDKVGKHIACPECHRALIPVSAIAPAPTVAGDVSAASSVVTSGAQVPAAAEGQKTKVCPFCGERILAVAKKCRYCGEFVDESAMAAAAGVKTAPPTTPPAFVLAVSQWDNFFKYVVCLIIVVGMGFLLFDVQFVKEMLGANAPWVFMGTLILMGLIAFMFFVGARSAKCRIWPTRIETQVGFIAKQMDSLEVSRITDLEIKQGIFARILGVGTIVIRTTDVNTPMMELYMIPKARRVYKYLQAQIAAAGKGANES